MYKKRDSSSARHGHVRGHGFGTLCCSPAHVVRIFFLYDLWFIIHFNFNFNLFLFYQLARSAPVQRSLWDFCYICFLGGCPALSRTSCPSLALSRTSCPSLSPYQTIYRAHIVNYSKPFEINHAWAHALGWRLLARDAKPFDVNPLS